MKNYIIAEVGPNHNGNANIAISMIEQLADIGVDAVKFQLTNPESFYSLDSFKPKYQRESVKKLTPIQMARQFKLSNEEHITLYNKCKENNVDYLCSAFDIDSLKFIDNKFDLRFFKVASGEIFRSDKLPREIFVSAKCFLKQLWSQNSSPGNRKRRPIQFLCSFEKR